MPIIAHYVSSYAADTPFREVWRFGLICFTDYLLFHFDAQFTESLYNAVFSGEGVFCHSEDMESSEYAIWEAQIHGLSEATKIRIVLFLSIFYVLRNRLNMLMVWEDIPTVMRTYGFRIEQRLYPQVPGCCQRRLKSG